MKPVQRVSRFAPRLVALLIAGALLALPAAAEETAGGALTYTDPETGKSSEFPLQHTSVEAAVSGTVAEVTVRQRFANPFDRRLEAVYVFPLPDRAAVDDMSIRTGDRLIKGEIHRRAEAQEIYRQAREAGHLAGLLDQERPNIFTQRLANLLPGESVEVEIHYVEDLKYRHGTWHLIVPTVVGPRYIPGGPTGRTGSGWSPDTDRVPDASHITPPVLEPGRISGHHIDITVDLAPGFTIADLASPSHEVGITRRGPDRARVLLAPLDTVPNKDFELTWRTAGPAITAATVAHKTGDLGYLTLILQPPAQPRADQIVPREVVFVLDTSGSMSGEPVAACKQLVRKAITRLRGGDTFRLIQFSGAASQLDPEALPANPTNIERALSYLDGFRGRGGTEMLEGVRAALEQPADPRRLRMVLFLTDGYIGNEAEILRRITEHLGAARIFAFGVGSSVNRYLLDRLAVAGRGVAEYLRPGESPDVLVERFYERITDPVFTQLELDWGGLDVVDVEPKALPDLFAAQPLLVHARYRSGGGGTVTLRGNAGASTREVSVDVRLPKREKRHSAQARLWARARIARLEIENLRSNDQQAVVEEITGLALEHRLMTTYTSFVAVDRSEVRDDGELVTVDQPLPMPQGVSYDGVFGESAGQPVYVVKQVKGTSVSPAYQSLPKMTQVHPEPILGFSADENLILDVSDAPPPPEPAGRFAAVDHPAEPGVAPRTATPRDQRRAPPPIKPADPTRVEAPPEIRLETIDTPEAQPAVTGPRPLRCFHEVDLPLLFGSLLLLLLMVATWLVRRTSSA